MIITFNNFILNEEYSIVIKDELLNILKEMDKSAIRDDLLNLIGVDNKDLNINYIDRGDDVGTVKYISDIKVTNLIKKDSQLDDDWYLNNTSTRAAFAENITPTVSKIGRLISNMSKLNGKKYKASEIEDFVNKYKAFLDYQKDLSRFQIYKGDDILKMYSTDYTDNSVHSSELSQSCMMDMNNTKPGILNIYTQNNNVSGLILKNKSGKIIGRCLLWNNVADKSGKKYNLMDKIYYIYPSDKEVFIKWGKENKYLIRNTSNNLHDDYKKMFIDSNGVELMLNLKVKIKNIIFDFYPYVDTFQYLDRKNNIGYNYEPTDKVTIKLNETDGAFEGRDSFGKAEKMCIDAYTGLQINEDDAVFSEYHDGYILVEDSIEAESYYGKEIVHKDSDCYISYDNDYYMTDLCVEDYKGVMIPEKFTISVFDEDDELFYAEEKDKGVVYSDKDIKYYFSKECVWSETLNSYILKKDSKKITIKETGEVDYIKKHK